MEILDISGISEKMYLTAGAKRTHISQSIVHIRLITCMIRAEKKDGKEYTDECRMDMIRS